MAQPSAPAPVTAQPTELPSSEPGSASIQPEDLMVPKDEPMDTGTGSLDMGVGDSGAMEMGAGAAPVAPISSYNSESDPLATLAIAAASSAVTSIKPEVKPPAEEVRSPTTPSKKDGNQWYDVGIIKGTSCLVSYYHLPSENAVGNGEVEKKVNIK